MARIPSRSCTNADKRENMTLGEGNPAEHIPTQPSGLADSTAIRHVMFASEGNENIKALLIISGFVRVELAGLFGVLIRRANAFVNEEQSVEQLLRSHSSCGHEKLGVMVELIAVPPYLIIQIYRQKSLNLKDK